MLEIVRLYLAGFGVVAIAGGVVGFVKAKSKASLIAGGISGALLIVSGTLISNVTAALGLSAFVSLALAIRFGNAFRKTKKLMPAGLIALLGMIGVVLTLLAFPR